jgi:hypothetical protein
MSTNVARAAPDASRIGGPSFAHPRKDEGDVVEAFVAEVSEEIDHGDRKDFARKTGIDVHRVHAELERRQNVTLALARGALVNLPAKRDRLASLAFAKTGLVHSFLPVGTLVPSPLAAAASALRELLDAVEAAALSESDGLWTSEEASELGRRVDRAMPLALAAKASAETCAGLRLLP